MPLPLAKTPPTWPWTPPTVLPELPVADDSERPRPVLELDDAAATAGLRDQASIQPPSAPCHSMGHQPVLELDDAD